MFALNGPRTDGPIVCRAGRVPAPIGKDDEPN
jgi:hypothetical protein